MRTPIFAPLLLTLLLAACAGADGPGLRLLPDAPQRPHPQAVPHTDRSGALLHRYDPERSFLPLALGGAMVDYRHGVTRGFAAAFAADFNAVVADPEQPLPALIRAAEGSGVLLLRPQAEATAHPALLNAAAVAVVELPRDPARIDRFAAAVRAAPPDRPVWAMLPAHGKADLPMPNPAQARALAFAALVHGASGLIWQGEDNYAARNAGAVGIAAAAPLDYGIGISGEGVTPPYRARPEEVSAGRRLWDAAAQLNRRLTRLKPALLRPDAMLDHRIAIAADAEPRRLQSPVRSLVRPWENGELLMILVNLERRPHDVRIDFPRPPGRILRFPGEPYPTPTAYDAATGRLSEPLEAHGVRLYLLSP